MQKPRNQKTQEGRTNESLTNLALTLTCIGIPLFATDCILKGLHHPKSHDRIMLLSGSELTSTGKNFRSYQPNRKIEQSAVYGDQIAYRSQYKSNNLGLVSLRDIRASEKLDVAIAGDSFTEGQGGYPWILDFQKTMETKSNLKSMSYAIAGSGFGDFAATGKDAKKAHGARSIIIFSIEHDAYRPWQKMGSNKNCSYYSNGALDHLLGPFSCSVYGIVWHHVSTGLSDRELLIEARKNQSFGLIPTLSETFRRLGSLSPKPPKQEAKSSANPSSQSKHNNSPTSPQEIQPALGTSKPYPNSSPEAPSLRLGPLPMEAKTAIYDLNKIYGADNVLWVLLPDTPNANTAKSSQPAAQDPFAAAINIAGAKKIANLRHSCKMSVSDFNTLDNHPNKKGYAQLLNCIYRDHEVQAFILSKKLSK